MATAVAEEGGSSPQTAGLEQNFPNPFNATTAIPYALSREQRVRLEIYDLAGQRIRTLADGSLQGGRHLARWDGLDQKGAPVASGVYLYRLQADGAVFVRSMLLLR